MTVSFAAALHSFQTGDLAAAAAAFDDLVVTEAHNPDVWHMGGIVAMKTGDAQTAIQRFETAMTHKAEDARLHFDYGSALEAAQRSAQAIVAYQKAIGLPNCPVDAIARLGVLVARLAGAEKALPLLQAAITHGGATQDVWSVLGRCLCETQAWSQALEAAEHALVLGPSIEAMAVKAWALRVLGRSEEALMALQGDEHAYADHAEYWHQRALCASESGHMLEAYEAYDQAVSRAPNGANYAYNKGVAAQTKQDWPAAQVAFEQAITLNPEHAAAHHNLALLHLFSGDTQKAWPHYEYRRKLPDFSGVVPELTEWTGQDLSGVSLLVTSEQGLGDTLQFMRYLPQVLDRGAQVSVYVNPGLEPVVSCVDSRLEVVTEGAVLAHEYWCPLQSLPLRLGTDQAAVPYIKPRETHLSPWEARLRHTQKPRVGLVWAGNPKNKNDHNRSLSVTQLSPLLSQTGVEWMSLQFGSSALSQTSYDITDLMPHVSHFMDTAGLMQHLDLLITVDTAVVHMAGAMGLSTWLLTPARGHWVWGHTGETSPWYPSIRIFRQDEKHGWSPTIEHVSQALKNWIDQRVGTGSSPE